MQVTKIQTITIPKIIPPMASVEISRNSHFVVNKHKQETFTQMMGEHYQSGDYHSLTN